MAHLFTALWWKSYAVLGVDFSNGFNSMSRQLTSLFNLFYARDSLCFFAVGDDIRVVRGQQGSRMGCVLGSFGFDLVCQDVYEAASKRVPSAIVRALTDDVNAGVPPQSTIQEQLGLCGQLYTTLRDEAKRVAGLEVNTGKTKLLLPPQSNGSPIDLGTLQLPEDFPHDLQLVTDGLKVAGAPVGSDHFVETFTSEALLDVERRALAVQHVDPQVGLGLLRLCVSTAPTFLAQVTPPMLTHALFADLDSKLVDSALELLVPAGHSEPSYSEERRQRAEQRLQLPLRHKGAGIVSIALRHPIAYFASVASCLALDPALAEHIDGLQRFAPDAHARVLALLGPASSYSKPVEELICRDDQNILLSVTAPLWRQGPHR